MSDELQAAIAYTRKETGNEPWTAEQFAEGGPADDFDAAIVTILNAVVSGALVPAPAVQDDVADGGGHDA